jgi:hypothetical protein
MANLVRADNAIAPNQTVVWYTSFPAGDTGTGDPTYQVPFMIVVPSTATPGGVAGWELTGGGYPYVLALGIGTQWYQLSDDAATLYAFTIVQNNGSEDIEYSIYYSYL